MGPGASRIGLATVGQSRTRRERRVASLPLDATPARGVSRLAPRRLWHLSTQTPPVSSTAAGEAGAPGDQQDNLRPVRCSLPVIGLRGTFVLVVLTMLVPLTLLGLWQVHGRMAAYENMSLQDEQNNAEAVETAFAAYLQNTWTGEFALGEAMLHSTAGEPRRMQELLLGSAPNYPGADFLSWVGPDGQVVASTDLGSAERISAASAYVRTLAGGQNEAVSDLMLSGETNTPTVLIYRAIRENGQLQGIVVVGEDARTFGTLLPRPWSSQSWFGVVDTQGRLVYRSDTPNIPMSQRDLPQDSPAIRALGGKAVVWERYRTADGRLHMSAAVPVPNIGWSVFTSTPDSAITAEAHREAANALADLLLVACGSVLTVILISNRVLDHMHRLRTAADAIAGGDRTARVGTRERDELGQTAQAFDQMADRIQATEKQIRRRVAQQAVVATLGQRALDGAAIPALFEIAVSLVARTLEVEWTLIAECCSPNGGLVVQSAFGLGQGSSAGLTVPVDPDSLASRVLHSKTPQIVSTATETRLDSAEGPIRIRSAGALGVPISGHSGRYGLLEAHSAAHHAFSPEDVHFVQAVAHILAAAIAHRRTEDELTTSRERFRALVEACPVPIITSDAGAITAWNPAAERVFGWEAAEVLGRPTPLVPEDQWEESRQLVERLAGGEATVHTIVRRRRRDGTLLDMIVTAALLPGSHEPGHGVITAYVDVSDRNRFLQIAAHELRNPLATAKSVAALMRRRGERGMAVTDVVPMARMVEQEIDRVAALVNEILDAFRAQEGRVELKPERLDLTKVIRSATEPMSAVLSGTHRLVVRGCEEGRFWIDGDCRRLEEVVRNLLGNAIKYSPDGGDIQITVAASDAYVRVSVADEGIGIPAAHLDRVFEQFFRAGNLDGRDPGGLGLGLFICRDIIHRHGGHIWVESIPGKGTTFHVEIPMGADQAVLTG